VGKIVGVAMGVTMTVGVSVAVGAMVTVGVTVGVGVGQSGAAQISPPTGVTGVPCAPNASATSAPARSWLVTSTVPSG
jgi:hypothetical protein